MQESQQEEVEKIAERYKVSPEFARAVLTMKSATSMLEKLEAFKKEQTLIEQGDPEAIQKQQAEFLASAMSRIRTLTGDLVKTRIFH